MLWQRSEDGCQVARGFNMTVNAYSPTLTHDDLRKEGEYGVYTVYSNRELFMNSDFLSLHMPLLKKHATVWATSCSH